MLDSTNQTPTPGQVLAGTPPNPGMPPYSRPGQPPSLQAQAPAQAQQQPTPTPQQVVNAKHTAVGRAASFLFGAQHDSETGAPIKQRPGDVFRSLLMGAMLGSALGSEGKASDSSVGSFLGGVGRGASGVEQQAYERNRQSQADAQRRQQMSLEEQRAADEHVLNQATVAHLTAETTSFHHLQEFQDQDALDKKNRAAQAYKQVLLDAGGRNAPIAINGRVPANGEYSAPDIAAAYMKDNTILMGPPGTVRHFVDVHNASDLEYVPGKGWVNESGDPVDMSKSTVVRAIDVPENLYQKTIKHTGKEINAIAGYQLIPPDQEDKTFNAPLNAYAGLYAQNLKNLNAQAQAKQRNADAEKAKAQANKAATVKRGTPAQFAQVEAKKAAELAKAEKAYENDGDEAALASAKAGAQKAYEDEVRALGGSITPARQRQVPASTPKKGDTQTHAGFNYTFDGRQWVKGQAAQ